MRTYQLFKDGAGKFGFRLIAADGKTVLTSSVYATKLDAQRGIDLVRIHGRFEANYEQRNAFTGLVGQTSIKEDRLVPITELDIFPRTLAEEWREGTAAGVLAQSLFAPAGRPGSPGLDALLQAGVRQALLHQGLVLTACRQEGRT